LGIVRRFRELTAARAEVLANTIDRPVAETLTAEVLPLLEACRYLERSAEQLLSPKRPKRDAPLWMRSVELVTYREPFGTILIIGPANYPIFLVGVQVLQALAAGNAVVIKPGLRGSSASLLLVRWLREAGLPEELAFVLDESPEAAVEAIRSGFDKIVVTGSGQTGKAVLALAAASITPVVAELSGWDPVFLLRDADVGLVAAALRFGATLNEGNTCIRPRVVYGRPEILARVRLALGAIAGELDFVTVSDEREAIEQAANSEYALGATFFGNPAEAKALAAEVRAGVVVINDMIAPTAHPGISFGGRGSSGFGVTRGPEGLLEMTATKNVATQKSRWHPHLQPLKRGDAKLFSAFARMCHGGALGDRLRAAGEVWRATRNRLKET
jgi:aldehyde dehydrogenase (NAD+)